MKHLHSRVLRASPWILVSLAAATLAACGDDMGGMPGTGGGGAGGAAGGDAGQSGTGQSGTGGGAGEGGEPVAGAAGVAGEAGSAGAAGVAGASGNSGEGGAAGEAGTAGTEQAVSFDATELELIGTLSPLGDVPADPTNAVADDAGARALGQQLFFDKRYSGALAALPTGEVNDLGIAGETGKVSCASCHSSAELSDDRSDPPNVSLGTNRHPRNAPGLVNSSFYLWTNWAGRFSAQWELPPVVAENAVIMNSNRLRIAHHLFDHYRSEYEAVFGAMEPAIGNDPLRFPADGKPKPVTNPPAADGAWEGMDAGDQLIVNRILVNFGKALAAYTRQLVSRNAPFDRFVVNHDSSLSQSAQRGLKLFIGQARCVICHDGPKLADDQFHNIGVPQVGASLPPHVPAADLGRFNDASALIASGLNSAGVFSDDPAAGALRLAGLTTPMPAAARGQFRTPSLRGVALTAPYMHSGQLATLQDVVDFYDAADPALVQAGTTRDPQIVPLHLSAAQKSDLVEFLKSLDGEALPPALLVDTSGQ